MNLGGMTLDELDSLLRTHRVQIDYACHMPGDREPYGPDSHGASLCRRSAVGDFTGPEWCRGRGATWLGALRAALDAAAARGWFALPTTGLPPLSAIRIGFSKEG